MKQKGIQSVHDVPCCNSTTKPQHNKDDSASSISECTRSWNVFDVNDKELLFCTASSNLINVNQITVIPILLCLQHMWILCRENICASPLVFLRKRIFHIESMCQQFILTSHHWQVKLSFRSSWQHHKQHPHPHITLSYPDTFHLHIHISLWALTLSCLWRSAPYHGFKNSAEPHHVGNGARAAEPPPSVAAEPQQNFHGNFVFNGKGRGDTYNASDHLQLHLQWHLQMYDQETSTHL